MLRAAFSPLRDAGLCWLVLSLAADNAVSFDVLARRLLPEVELNLFHLGLRQPGGRFIASVDFAQLDQSVLGDIDQCLQLLSEAFLLEKQVMVEEELPRIRARGVNAILHLFSEDLAINPGIKSHQSIPNFEQLLSQEGILLHCQSQLPLVALQQKGVFLSLFLAGCAQREEDFKAGLALFAHALLHLFTHARCLCFSLLDLMQDLFVLGPQCGDDFAVVFSFFARLRLSFFSPRAQSCQFVLQGADLFDMLFDGPLCLLCKAAKFISFKLDSCQFFLRLTAKLQILLPAGHKFNQASQCILIISIVRQISKSHSPTCEDAASE